ncbi:hypothetical protein 162309595 [Organic Lake phycodnavirus]|jgi:hypothetical protein|nr:hypothetical protein 162309595 [Organic Lake phycodnavirus]
MNFKKIILRQNDNKQYVQYEDPNGIVYRELNDDDFNALLEKINFHDEFALPDRMVQDYITDSTIMPTFKKSILFNDEDMNHLIEPFNTHKKKKKRPKVKTSKKKRKTKKVQSKRKTKKVQSKRNKYKQKRY